MLVAVYAAMAAGVLLLALLAAWRLRPAEPRFDPALPRVAWLAAAAGGLAAAAWARRRFEQGGRSVEEGIRSAVLVWALAEAPALLGVIGYVLTGDRAILVLALIVFAWAMARHPPAAFRPESG